MADFSLVKDSSPLYGLLEMASLRLPDSDEFDFNSRRRADQGSLTASSTDAFGSATTPTTSRSHPLRPALNDNMNLRILGDTGTGFIDMLIDLALKSTNATDKQAFVDNLTTAGEGTSFVTNSTSEVFPEYYYRHSAPVTAMFCVAYLVVFVVGLCGNSMVINVVFRSPRMWTVTNYFIVNLAFADILVIVFCVPATLMSNIFVPWVLGWYMCKFVPYIQGVSVAASVYSLIGVSLDRFLAIWWPMKCQITKRRARFMIFMIWVIALGITIPWAMYFDMVAVPEMGVWLCIEVLPNATTGALTFLIANVLCCYILPTIVILTCYIFIWIKVSKRDIPTDTKDAQIERMQQKSRVKVVKMLVVVVILFVLSWLPLYVIFAGIKLDWDVSGSLEDVLQYALPIAQWFGSSNSCINPILYAFFNKKFRRGFVAIWKSKRLCGRLRYYETVAMMSSSGSSMRKSSYYVQNNNNASTRRVPATGGQDAAVSYISNNTGI